MSAWIVSKGHIDALVGAMARRELLTVSPDEAGRLLWRENHRSIRYRYSHIPEEAKRRAPHYDFTRPPTAWTPSELLKITGCYDYQSCERPDYETSRAYRMVKALEEALEREGASRESAEYEQAPWGLPVCGGRHADWQGCTEECAAVQV